MRAKVGFLNDLPVRLFHKGTKISRLVSLPLRNEFFLVLGPMIRKKRLKYPSNEGGNQ